MSPDAVTSQTIKTAGEEKGRMMPQALRREGAKGRRGNRRLQRGSKEKGEAEGGRRGPAIFHRFRVQANFNNIRSIRYGRPHIKSVRANEAPPERWNMMSGG